VSLCSCARHSSCSRQVAEPDWLRGSLGVFDTSWGPLLKAIELLMSRYWGTCDDEQVLERTCDDLSRYWGTCGVHQWPELHQLSIMVDLNVVQHHQSDHCSSFCYSRLRIVHVHGWALFLVHHAMA